VQSILSSRALSTRGGTVALGVAAAALAGVILLVYASHYRKSVSDSNQPVSVLIAKRLIEKGTSADVIARSRVLETTTLAQKDLQANAVSDLSAMSGRVTVDSIYPGQQITTSDFAASRSDALATQLTANQRAIAVPLDSSHGLIGNVRTGDRVDVMAGFDVQAVTRAGTPVNNSGQARPVLRVIMRDLMVLSAPAAAKNALGATASQNVVLRTSPQQAADLAFASDNGKLWLVLRPRTGARPTTATLVTPETLLLGVNPVMVLHSLGGQR
jgi:Flp pilus assembly protein CpaB